jgi:hypothetical protein
MGPKPPLPVPSIPPGPPGPGPITGVFDGNCEIRRAGVTPEGLAQVDLKDVLGTFDWTWFLSAPEKTNQVLAAALTAIASNKQVFCQINLPIAPWAQVIRFGVDK